MTLSTDLSDDEAMALAQFCKRHTYEDLRQRSANEAEYEAMSRAFMKVRDDLRRNGFNPR